MSNELNQYDTEGENHGYWIRYYHTGKLWYKGEYVHGKCYGYWIIYDDDCELSFKRFYAR